MSKDKKYIEEATNKVKYKYPEILQALKKLYRHAFVSGENCIRGINEGDGYDWSTSYREIEPLMRQALQQQKEDFIKELKEMVDKGYEPKIILETFKAKYFNFKE